MQAEISTYDYAIVGGGLSGGLAALTLLTRRPQARVALIERGRNLGGNHTWSFHADDVPPDMVDVVEPLVVHRWPGYHVKFPRMERTLRSAYAMTDNNRLDAVLRAALEATERSALLHTYATDVLADTVRCADGRSINARVVLDARGPERLGTGRAAYQKFLGLDVELEGDNAPLLPFVMDATVPQDDGFRFTYILPLAPNRLLIEDTYFSDTADLQHDRLHANIEAQLAARQLVVKRIVRREHGVLPLPLAGEPPTISAPLRIGYGGGWFHPTTGYSFPIAVRVAAAVAACDPGDVAPLQALVRQLLPQWKYAWLLNRMLFDTVPKAERWHILARFYCLPEATIERFYALNMTRLDRLRIVFGRPPRGLSWRAAAAAAWRSS